MPYYITPGIGSGTHTDGFRPRASDQPGSSWLDLDFLGATLNTRRYILWLPVADNDPLIEFMAEDMDEPVPPNVKTKLENKLGMTLTGTTFSEIIGEIMTKPPAGKWNAIKPLRNRVEEVWLGGKQVYLKTPIGSGSIGTQGQTINIDDLLETGRQLGPKRGREFFIDMLGYIPIMGAALPFTDTFTNTDGTALTSHNASWSNTNGTFVIRNNSVQSNTDLESGARWTGDSFNADHYSFGVHLNTGVAGKFIGPGGRMSATSFYAFYTDGTNVETYMSRIVSGSANAIQSSFHTGWDPGDIMRLECEGSTLRGTDNGTHTGLSPWTDTNLTTGAAGVAGYGTGAGTNTAFTNMELGNLSSTTYVKKWFYL